MSLLIDIFMCRSDNYGYLVHDSATGKTAAIDAPEGAAIESALKRRGWTLSDIFITHHHTDHTDGIRSLKQHFSATVSGPKSEAEKIPAMDLPLEPGETVSLGASEFTVLPTPGHTLGHIAYHDAKGGHLFTGDALFSMGCGRMFEGKPLPMWEGLLLLRALPDRTLVYCGHEYTVANAKFALSVEPKNAALKIRAAEVERMRGEEKFTIPVTLGMEKATNPFLRADLPQIAVAMGLVGAKPESVFAALRKAKDNFKQ